MQQPLLPTLESLTPVPADQRKNISETERYLNQHKIDNLFQELLATLIETRSTSPQRTLVETLMAKKQKIMFFSEQDFENLFQYYDPHGTKSANPQHLLRALLVIGIHQDIDTIKLRYPSQLSKGYLYQDEFIDILRNEYFMRHK